jgi:hypothetical protein
MSSYNVQVTLISTDNEGSSGVNKTEYGFENATWVEYNAEFVTTEGTTTLYYRSIDNAGNIESTKNHAIKIDKSGTCYYLAQCQWLVYSSI